MNLTAVRYVIGTVALSLGVAAGMAHVTPPRVLVSDQEAVQGLLAAARTFSMRDVRLSAVQRQAIKKECGWRPDEKSYRCYIGRDDRDRFVGTVVFIGEITTHGLVRMAVGIEPDGKIGGATVVAVTDENYVWIKPLIDQSFARDYVGQDYRSQFGQATGKAYRDSMSKFYGQVLATLVHRGAIICHVSEIKAASLLMSRFRCCVTGEVGPRS